jgi:hypothetical protein
MLIIHVTLFRNIMYLNYYCSRVGIIVTALENNCLSNLLLYKGLSESVFIKYIILTYLSYLLIKYITVINAIRLSGSVLESPRSEYLL